MKTIILILSFLILILTRVNAQVFTHYRSLDEYNYINSIVEDNAGNIWFGTYAGLFRFDGSNLISYNPEGESERIMALAMTTDTGGNIWIGTPSGVLKFDGNHFSNFNSNDSLMNYPVWAIDIDNGGNIWCGSFCGVFKFDGAKWTTYTTDDGLVDNFIQAIETDAEDNIWIGTLSRGISKFDKTSWTTYSTDNGLVSNHVQAIETDAEGNIWIGTRNGVSKFNGTNWTNFLQANSIEFHDVQAIVNDAEENIWFGTALGVLKYDGTSWTSYTEEDGLAYNSISTIASDRDGYMWFGLGLVDSWHGEIGKGISKFDGNNWKNFLINDNSFVGWGGCLAFDKKGNLWVGGTSGGFSGLSKYDGIKWSTFISNNGFENPNVLTINTDTENNVWFGTTNGVSMYDGTAWAYFTEDNGLVNNYVQAIAIDSIGNVWFGTLGGVSKFDGTDWTNYTVADGLAGNNVHSIAIDSIGNIWCGSLMQWDNILEQNIGGGVSKFDGSNWTTYTESDGLINNDINSIAIDVEGNIWCGSQKQWDNTLLRLVGGGLSKFDGTNWINYTTEDGLNDNQVNAIALDSIGNIWFGTNGGLSKYDGTNWTNYTVDDGLATNRIDAVAIDKNGDVWISSIYVITKISFTPETTSPTAEITYSNATFRYGNTLIITATFNKPMDDSITVKFSMSGAVTLVEAEMTRVNERVYTYTYLIPDAVGQVMVTFNNGSDLYGNEVVPTPTYGGSFTILPTTYIANTNKIPRILIYPNPATGELTIESEKQQTTGTIIELLDISGKVVYAEIIAPGEVQHQINLSSFEEGLYLIHISNEQYSYTEKVIKVE